MALLSGPFVWHKHDETDDFFLVIGGHLTIHLRDGDIELDPGELYVVPRGVEHCPDATDETLVLLIEPDGTLNTGDAGGPMTADPHTIQDPAEAAHRRPSARRFRRVSAAKALAARSDGNKPEPTEWP